MMKQLDVKKLEESRIKLREKIKQRREEREKLTKFPPPLYDEVYYKGIHWLDSL
jgi:hypothetical protein